MVRQKFDPSGHEPALDGGRDSVTRLHKPTARECALLLLRLMQVKEQERGREVTRLRVAEISLRRLWGRRRISPEFAEEVAEWLSSAGVTLFFAGSIYAVVKTASSKAGLG